jgi:hypothetical protein
VGQYEAGGSTCGGIVRISDIPSWYRIREEPIGRSFLMQARSDAADYLSWQVNEAEKAIGAGNLEEAGLMMYQAVKTAMIGLAQVRNLPHTDHDDLLRLARSLDEEHGTAGSHFVRFEAARAMHDNAQLHFLNVEETLMSPENAREFIRSLEEYRAAA